MFSEIAAIVDRIVCSSTWYTITKVAPYSIRAYVIGNDIATYGQDKKQVVRPDYCDLKQLKQRFPGIPFMALTATATPRVRADVVSQVV